MTHHTLGTWVARGALSIGAGVALLVAAAAASGMTQEAATGPADIELISGERIAGRIVAEYERNGELDGIVVERHEGTPLYLPYRYLSRRQRYWLSRWEVDPPQHGHPLFRGRAPDKRAAIRLWDLGDDALMANLWRQAEQHFREALALAEQEGGAAERKNYEEHLARRLQELGIHTSTLDGRWVSLETWHTEQGHVRFRDRWVAKEERDRLLAEESKSELRTVRVRNAREYSRVQLHLLRAFPGEWSGQRAGRKVHSFGQLVTVERDGFPAIGKFVPGKWMRLRVAFDDCDQVYVATDSPAAKRLEHLEPGDRVVLYGRVAIDRGIILFEADDIALR